MARRSGSFTTSTEPFRSFWHRFSYGLLIAAAFGLLVLGKADIVLVDATHPIMRPLRDPLRSLVYTAAERAVRDVYVDGVLRVEDGQVLTFDFNAAAEAVEQGQRRAEATVAQRNPKGLTGRDISPLALEEI